MGNVAGGDPRPVWRRCGRRQAAATASGPGRPRRGRRGPGVRLGEGAQELEAGRVGDVGEQLGGGGGIVRVAGGRQVREQQVPPHEGGDDLGVEVAEPHPRDDLARERLAGH